MLQAIGRSSWYKIDRADIDNFPCEDMCTINQLWIQYSKGQFGFSIQHQIWKEVGGKVEMTSEKNLSDRVGWRKNRKWLNQSELIFSLDAPRGHLPAITEGRLIGIRPWISYEAGVYFPPSEGWGISSLLQRFVTCNENAISEPKPEVPLKSERGVDYTKLRDLLAAGEWEEADQETSKVMRQAAGSEGPPSIKDIDNFPCEDLRTILDTWHW